MELCPNRPISNAAAAPGCQLLPTTYNLRLLPSMHRRNRTVSGSVTCRRLTLRATMSDETPSLNKFDKETSSRVEVMEDVPPVENNTYSKSFEEETRTDDSPLDGELQPFGEVFDNLNLKLNLDDSYSLVLYGGGAVVSIWLLSAIVGAIDSIPVFPKLMEVVGLSFSFWFTARYIVFKKNRDELTAKIEELKQQVIGREDE